MSPPSCSCWTEAELWNRPLMSALFVDLVSTGVRLATIDEIGILRHFFEKLLPQTLIRKKQLDPKVSKLRSGEQQAHMSMLARGWWTPSTHCFPALIPLPIPLVA